MKVWVNGALADGSDAVIPVFDHGLTTGDGVFETAKIVSGRPFALTRHLDRLALSALGIGLPRPDLALVRGAVDEVLAANRLDGAGRLRITYTGGVSPLGSERGPGPPTLVIAVSAAKSWAEAAAVATVPWSRNERGATAGLKTTSYAENVRALAYAAERGASEAIFANTVGNLCEGTGTNVFVRIADRLVTPPLTAGCLAGVTRALVLEWVGADEQDVPMAAFEEADEIFLTSSTRDVQAVHRVDGRQLHDVPGPLTRKAGEVFAERSTHDIDP
ncbi:MAG: aminotransferase class IV [Carbonactinosporaceae bacterium]